MNEFQDQLLTLGDVQDLDRRIDDLRREQAEIPKKLEVIRERIVAAESKYKKRKERLEELDKSRLAKERELEEYEARLVKDNKKLESVANDDIYQKLVKEIAQIKAANDARSDDILILMDKIETEQLGLRKISDAAYLGGLLHDIGKIVLHSLDPEVIRGINGLNLDRTENSTAVLEEITLGLSHAEVGARLAERWNFSDELTDVIRNHHSAFAAKPEHRTAVSVVHIADAFIRVEEKKVSYVYFDVEAQGQLGIRRTRDLEALHEHVRGRASLAAGA